jgi:glutathione S-transferase
MSETITFYTNPMSRGQIARWMLEEVGEPYETVLLDYGTTMKAPDYLAINPMGKVPAIKHGDTIVTEGAAICTYLADMFPDRGLAPPPGASSGALIIAGCSSARGRSRRRSPTII